MRRKMISKTLLSFFALFFFALTLQTYSQTSDLYIPRNIQKAYENGTRSYDGKPGPNYWQNGSDYKIKAEVNPETSILSGTETITYHNNSPYFEKNCCSSLSKYYETRLCTRLAF